MSFSKKQINGMKKEINAGGTDNVPPALCPPPAHVSACVPAYVERTRRAVTNATNGMGIGRHPGGNSPILFIEWAA